MITENKLIMGVPVYRFYIDSLQEGICEAEEHEYFEAGWKCAVRAYQLSKIDCNFICREWRDNVWIDITEKAIAEGKKRSERVKNVRKTRNDEFRRLSERQVGRLNDMVMVLKAIIRAGKRAPVDYDTTFSLGIGFLNVLQSLGFKLDDMKTLVETWSQAMPSD